MSCRGSFLITSIANSSLEAINAYEKQKKVKQEELRQKELVLQKAQELKEKEDERREKKPHLYNENGRRKTKSQRREEWLQFSKSEFFCPTKCHTCGYSSALGYQDECFCSTKYVNEMSQNQDQNNQTDEKESAETYWGGKAQTTQTTQEDQNKTIPTTQTTQVTQTTQTGQVNQTNQSNTIENKIVFVI
jgi:hypothetical protein